jgi:hypothetical protein
MSHESDPKVSGLDEIQARRSAFAERLAEMSVIPCDMDGQPTDSHPVIHFPKARRHDPNIAEPGEW